MKVRSASLLARRCYLFRHALEALEQRMLLAVDVLNYRYDAANTGLNAAETSLTTANVNATTFGKKFTATLDGQVYAQPLVKTFVNITRGSSQGVHNVVYAATQHGSLYAIDANSGSILWQDTLLNISDPTDPTVTTGVSTVFANTTVNDTINTTDLNPEIGILSTPVIDPATNLMYVTMISKEYRTGTTPAPDGVGDRHFVQRLWAIDISSGAAVRSTVIADTVKNTAISPLNYQGYQYFGGPFINGTGNNGIVVNSSNQVQSVSDGWDPSTDPNHLGYDPDASGQIAFNAVLQMNRPATTLVNGVIYLAYASHGDRGPYYGWVLGYRASDLALVGVFNAVPTFTGNIGDSPDPGKIYTAEGGVWMSGSSIASDGTYLYLTTANGAFEEDNSNFDADGFPKDHNYADCVVKLGIDPNSSPANQNGNGYGLKVFDYFTPSNQFRLNQLGADLGSGGVVLLPDSAGIAGHPHLMMTAGKEGRVYLIDRDNMGKFNLTYPKSNSPSDVDPRLYDRVLGEFTTGATNAQTHQMFSTAAYFNGSVYFATAADVARRFTVSTFASGSVPPGAVQPTPSQTTTGSFTAGARGPTFTISANGAGNGIVWGTNIGPSTTDNLLAWSAANFTAPIYDSSTNLARDRLSGGVAGATGVKFSVPVVANGMVYVGTGGKPIVVNTVGLGTLVGYGLLSAPTAPAAPSQPDLTGASDTGTSNADNITADNTPTFTGLALAGSTVSILVDGQSQGVAVAAGDGSFSITTAALADGSHTVLAIATTINGASTASSTLNINIMTAKPALVTSNFNYTGTAQTVSASFTIDVTASIQAGDLELLNTTTNAPVSSANLSVVVNPPNKFAQWSLLNIAGNALPDGAYLATIPTNAVEDLAGNHPANSITFTFVFLNGDANVDQRVNALDFNILASNYGDTGTAFVDADFNYDNRVNSVDFTVLAGRFGNVAAATAAVVNPSTALPGARGVATLFHSTAPIREDLFDSLDAPQD